MIRPCGVAPGAMAFAAAWVAAFVLAMLTGAPAVVILLVASAVGFVLAVITGALGLRGVVVDRVTTSASSTVGNDLRWHVSVRCGAPIQLELKIAEDVVASGIVTDGETVLDGVAPRRGVHTEIEARCTSGGVAGLVIWRRCEILQLAPLSVAPQIGDRAADVELLAPAVRQGTAPGPRPGNDALDGVRPWRDGDEVGSVHWPSSVRSRELIIRQRLRDSDDQRIVRARTGTGDSDGEASRVRRALEDGLTQHARVAVRVDDGRECWLEDRADIVRWCADFEADHHASSPFLRWWRRPIRIVAKGTEARLSARARWFVAAASAAPLVMMLQPLGYGLAQIAIVVAAVAAGAGASRWTAGRRQTVRQLAGLATGMLVAATLIDLSQITSIATSLRFLLPQILVVLVVLQGSECSDRRAARVSLAGAAFLTAYSAGVRVDAQLGPWMLVTTIAWVFALLEVSRPVASQQRSPGAGRMMPRAVAGRTAWLAGAAVVSLAILSVVPIPRGPAQLTLPTWLEERRPTAGDGGLAAPDGSPLLGGSAGASRGSDGTGGTSAGSYAGFSPTMDTSLRGDLGGEIVLRVRAPYPDFWRGQTYSSFDGRTWTADDRRGFRTDGPEHHVRPAVGDVLDDTDEFIQTFYPAVDLPNLIFAAPSARRVLLDAPLWQRPDGALRADVVLPAGSAYTVVSARATPTAARLRLDGDVAVYGSPAEYVQLPDSTSQRVRGLAEQLAEGSVSTYDTVRAIEQWFREHVVYDLDAPAPADGVDAVDDFLFQTRRGFCEQIATATTVMLRSLGVPARVATGFVPSERDQIAGVWISRARDAHAWVEVRFPGFGWVAFDPTASVPLAGEADDATIGGQLTAALRAWSASNLDTLFVAVAALVGGVLAVRGARRWRARRRRGRWGLLQDRFVAAALRRGALVTDSNAQLAAAFDEPRADAVARTLDASAFASSWVDDDGLFEETAAAVRSLETVS